MCSPHAGRPQKRLKRCGPAGVALARAVSKGVPLNFAINIFENTCAMMVFYVFAFPWRVLHNLTTRVPMKVRLKTLAYT